MPGPTDVVAIFADSTTSDVRVYLFTGPDSIEMAIDGDTIKLTPHAVRELRLALQKWERGHKQ